MGEMDRDFGDKDTRGEADQEGQPRPLVEDLLRAFRKASGRCPSIRQRSGEPEKNEPEEKPPPFEREPEPVPEPELKSSRSPVEVIEATMAAFRKAERHAVQSRAKNSSAEDRPADTSSAGTPRTEESGGSAPARTAEPAPDEPSQEESSKEEFPKETSGGPAETERKAKESEEPLSAEDLALAFRRALSERDRPGPRTLEEQSSEEGAPEKGGHGGESPPSSSADLSRSEATYLWVTDRPGEQQGTGRPGERSASIPVERLSEPRAAQAEAFLLRGEGERPYRLLRCIRGHPDASVYLKPVFWKHEEGEQSPVSMHVDGEWTGEEGVGALRETAAKINRRIETMVGAGGAGKGGVELRVLRFMATRDHTFTAHRTVENSDGFVYPELTPLLERESQGGGGELSRVLSMLAERRLLTGESVMRQHACRNCGCAFLNVEKMCPHCGSTELDADDLVHHFRCAFTGALSEYEKEDGRLVCPKCDRRLKQSGVDYDKPGVVYTCRRCHEEFQNPEVRTTCYRCEHTNPPEQQIEREIKEYEVTALGEETAIYGLGDSLLSILKRESRVLDYATFQLIVESEAARIERYQRSTSTLLLVRVAGLRKLRRELGERSQEVVEEIAIAFDNTLRSSDYLSVRDGSLYLFLLTETDQDEARRAGERLEENIGRVLNQNLAHPLELDIAVQPLQPGIDLDSLADQFLASPSPDRDAGNER